ncbi:hypothetical protein GGR53DRAFT_525738 [Hypoxylon sp. FL1150]|nr:hypothetical protein GGR53DRAFT_525738 [Hypoxylon sp. FL1150]
MSSLPQIVVSQSDQTPKHPVSVFSRAGLKCLRDSLRMPVYLSSDNLASLNVKCSEIDVNGGTPKDEGLKVLKLKSLDEMNAIAEANKLINADAIGPFGDYSAGNWHSSYTVALFYRSLLDEHSEVSVNAPRLLGKSLPEYSPWELSEERTVEFVTPSAIHWRACLILHPRDKSKPDSMCFLTNEASLKDGEVLSSELWCIFRLGKRQLEKKEYRNHKIAPVTVVSGSGRDLRVVQGYVDGADHVILRMSRIINIDNENRQQNLEGLMIIGRWLFGDPV